MVVLVGCFNTTFFTGFLGNNLLALGLEDWHVGLVYAVQSFFYLLTAMALPYTCEHLSRKVMFLMAMFFFGADMFLIGPSLVFNLPYEWYIVVAGFPILGIF